MCGIAGIFAFRESSFEITEELIARMRDTMEHRGPDGAGAWVSPDRRVGLGHRRLSIIDLSTAASQPMSNADGTLWIVFNGEIYNHAEIRAELEKLGRRRWKTDHSDTEVILHAFEEWGIECLHRFRGMFAIALYDARKRELWLVRDRIGIKPLCYNVQNGRVAFASEIKALLELPDVKRSVHEESLFYFLSFLASPAPQTLFEGVTKLAPGTWLRVSDDGSMEERRYWDVLDHAHPLMGVSDAEIAERLLVGLRTAVKLRKVSDVPVGVFLSGGIDSSTNAALFSEGEGRPVKTFTIGYAGDHASYPNETRYARMMAEKIGAEHHELLLTMDDLVEFLPRMVHLQDEPIADPVCVPVYYVSKLARDNGVIVCQVGEGADELFWGYASWKASLMLQRLDGFPVPRAFKQAGLATLRAAGMEASMHYEWLSRGAAGRPIFWGGALGFAEAHKHRVLSERLRGRFKGMTAWEALRPIRRRFEEKAQDPSHLHWMSYLDLNYRLPELLLMRVDKMGMGASVEGRVPFLDHKFVELAMSISEKTKTRGGELKHILKKAVRGVIPDELVDRKKQGFGVPIHEWFMDKLGGEAAREIRAVCRETDFFDPAEVERILSERRSLHAWMLLNFSLWWKKFVR